MKLFKKKENLKDKTIKELTRRRNEVVKRAAAVANRRIPQNILQQIESEADIMEWIVKPHLVEIFVPMKVENDEILRTGTENVIAYLHDKGVKNKKGDENNKTTDNNKGL